MYLSVKEVKTLDEYKLLLTFENGEIRLFDINPYLGAWEKVTGTKKSKSRTGYVSEKTCYTCEDCSGC